MRRFIYFLLIASFFLLSAQRVLSDKAPVPGAGPGDTPTPTPAKCGLANSTDAQQCCVTKGMSVGDIKSDVEGKVGGGAPGSGVIDLIPGDFDAAKALGLSNIIPSCFVGEPETEAATGNCICKQLVEPTPVTNLEKICTLYIKSDELQTCKDCVNSGGILSGIGCIPLKLSNFISNFLLGRLIGLGGIIALICIIYAAFQMQTSSGNPEKIKKAQEYLTSCVMGLMLIIFSVFIMRLIGVDILRIPGFGK